MSIDDLSNEVIEKIRNSRFDRIVEKHEGPFDWGWLLPAEKEETTDRLAGLFPNHDPVAETAEFFPVGDFYALFPIGRGQHPNLTILHYFLSEDQQKLVVYLKNTTYYDDKFSSGYMAICDRFAGKPFYVATLYHEWFIIDYVA